MSTDYYRRIFVTDMANRTASTDFNIFTPQQWQEGWNEMLVPGTYERGIFGDLMLPGIACGVRKILLIFNTNTNTPHDPIYIIDPSEFNVSPDTNIPVILSYNMSHYESMEPLTHDDVQATIDLIKDYKNGQYKYKNEDLPFLLNTESTSQEKQIQAKKNIGNEENKTASFDDFNIHINEGKPSQEQETMRQISKKINQERDKGKIQGKQEINQKNDTADLRMKSESGSSPHRSSNFAR